LSKANYHARNIGLKWLQEVGVTHGLTLMRLILLPRLTAMLEGDLRKDIEAQLPAIVPGIGGYFATYDLP